MLLELGETLDLGEPGWINLRQVVIVEGLCKIEREILGVQSIDVKDDAVGLLLTASSIVDLVDNRKPVS